MSKRFHIPFGLSKKTDEEFREIYTQYMNDWSEKKRHLSGWQVEKLGFLKRELKHRCGQWYHDGDFVLFKELYGNMVPGFVRHVEYEYENSFAGTSEDEVYSIEISFIKAPYKTDVDLYTPQVRHDEITRIQRLTPREMQNLLQQKAQEVAPSQLETLADAIQQRDEEYYLQNADHIKYAWDSKQDFIEPELSGWHFVGVFTNEKGEKTYRAYKSEDELFTPREAYERIAKEAFTPLFKAYHNVPDGKVSLHVYDVSRNAEHVVEAHNPILL
jgi:hypothetical protein